MDAAPFKTSLKFTFPAQDAPLLRWQSKQGQPQKKCPVYQGLEEIA